MEKLNEMQEVIPSIFKIYLDARDDNNSIDYGNIKQRNCSPLKRIANLENVNFTSETITTLKSPTELPLSHFLPFTDFRTVFYNATNSNQVIVLLKDPIYLYGTVKAKLIAGSIEVYGYTPIINEIFEIYSPRGCSTIKIEVKKNTHTSNAALENNLLSLKCYYKKCDLIDLIERYNKTSDAVLILKRNDHKKMVNNIKKYMTENVFPNMSLVSIERPFYTTEFLLRCIITTESDIALVLNPKWETVKIDMNSRIMVIGGKCVGKSTLVRYLINKNFRKYRKILLIDLDIGQPEIFVPQTISAIIMNSPLLGPGLFFNHLPDMSYVVGNTNVVLISSIYIKAVKKLLEYCFNNVNYSGIPWIINTMGYNKGFGSELIAIIIDFLKPTDIIQLQSNKEINNFNFIMDKNSIQRISRNLFTSSYLRPECLPEHRLHIFKTVVAHETRYLKEWDMSSRDLRYAVIIGRLSEIQNGGKECFTDCKPLCAPLDELKIFNLGEDHLNQEDLLQALDANVVYLCKLSNDNIHECFGIGIVRGIDYNLKHIYLTAATPKETILRINCLAVGEMSLPSSVLISQGLKVKGIAPYVYKTINNFGSKFIKQIYHRRQQSINDH